MADDVGMISGRIDMIKPGHNGKQNEYYRHKKLLTNTYPCQQGAFQYDEGGAFSHMIPAENPTNFAFKPPVP